MRPRFDPGNQIERKAQCDESALGHAPILPQHR
jgi:hypothetical protein